MSERLWLSVFAAVGRAGGNRGDAGRDGETDVSGVAQNRGGAEVNVAGIPIMLGWGTGESRARASQLLAALFPF